jgi:quinohemoprotein ethanol dehydrogenase
MREGDNLFCASVVALKAKTGEYAWHFQQVHHDIWDYDAASPVVLFDTVVNGEPRKGGSLRPAVPAGFTFLTGPTANR